MPHSEDDPGSALPSGMTRCRATLSSTHFVLYPDEATKAAISMSFARSPLIPGLIALIGILSLASLVIGPAPIAVTEALKALVVDQGSASIVVREIRLPRTLLALMIGWMFGLIGRRACRACCAIRSPTRRSSARRRRRPSGPCS